MADLQIGNPLGVTAVHIGNGANNPTNVSGTAVAQTAWEDDDLDTITAMRARLLAINPTLYSAANVNKMTYNDCVYAIRLSDAPTTIR